MSSCSLVIVHASLKNMVSKKKRLKFLVSKTAFSSKTAKNSWIPQFFEFRPKILHAYFWMHMQSNNDEKKISIVWPIYRRSFFFKNISESCNCNVAMKYFAIFQLQWNIENIPEIFLQYSVLCGYCCTEDNKI